MRTVKANCPVCGAELEFGIESARIFVCERYGTGTVASLSGSVELSETIHNCKSLTTVN